MTRPRTVARTSSGWSRCTLCVAPGQLTIRAEGGGEAVVGAADGVVRTGRAALLTALRRAEENARLLGH
ncbi:hypothetical protein [Amycolatopsis sp. NBC_01286]|uniref:hypothetical protein n=1 Tax=Amycolatopsis sp. NBC_01286 TaxID=2903560 RepID=UPI002E119177|nr:hypothetical protein OG570_42300 [Amycolatopsis sp. NBC_01286]